MEEIKWRYNMDIQKDKDEIIYEEYEFVPMAPMDNTAIPEEMKEFMSMCCMMGMMPMNNLISPMQRSFSVSGASPFIGNRLINIEDEYYEDNYSRVDLILTRMEKNNPGIFRFLERNGIPYDRARRLVRRIIRLTLMYCE